MLNGFLVTRLRLSDFIVTLATMGVAGEMAFAASHGPGTMAASFLDALHRLDFAELDRRLRIDARPARATA